MNYKDFDNTQASSPIELHKTDYNNYADLNHFIEQYNIAQQIIKECGKFYKSFLVSKLLTLEQIINLPYRDKIEFTKIEQLNDGTVFESNKILDIYTKYLSKSEYISFYYNKDYDYEEHEKPKDIEVVEDIVTAEKQIKSLKNKCAELEVQLAHDIVDNVPEKVIKKFGSFYSTNVTDKITKKNAKSWNILKKVVEDYDPRKDRYYGAIIDLMTPNVINYCKTQYDTIGQDIYKLKAEIELLENRIKYTKNRNKEKLCNELKEFVTNLNCKVISIQDAYSDYSCYDKYNKYKYYEYFFHLYDYTTNITFNGEREYKATAVISEKLFRSYMKKIEDYIIAKVRELNLESIFASIKDYFIIHNGELKKFSDNLDNVKIELSKNQKKLICTNVDVSEKAAYRWPSDAPTIRTTKTTTIVFNTENNELIDYTYNEDNDTIENKHKW